MKNVICQPPLEYLDKQIAEYAVWTSFNDLMTVYLDGYSVAVHRFVDSDDWWVSSAYPELAPYFLQRGPFKDAKSAFSYLKLCDASFEIMKTNFI